MFDRDDGGDDEKALIDSPQSGECLDRGAVGGVGGPPDAWWVVGNVVEGVA